MKYQTLIITILLISIYSYSQTEMKIRKTDGSIYSIPLSEIDSIFYEVTVSFTCGEPITDIDGNTYETIELDGQCWMAENLKTTRFTDGSEIPNATDDTTWQNLTIPAYCWYDNDAPSNKDVYGALYNGYTVETSNLCPNGWRIPSDEEWKQIEVHLGMSQLDADNIGQRGTNQGSQLAGNAALWSDNILENNTGFGTSGFSAIPGGNRNFLGSFSSKGHNGYFWSSTEFNSSNAWMRTLGYTFTTILRYYGSKQYGHSIRCVKD